MRASILYEVHELTQKGELLVMEGPVNQYCICLSFQGQAHITAGQYHLRFNLD